jgi:hypothetical protein
MKSLFFFTCRLPLASLCLSTSWLGVASAASIDTANIHESFDKNPTGNMLSATPDTFESNTITKGYGVNGHYGKLGAGDPEAFKIVENGLEFGTLNPPGGKCISVNAKSATGVGIYIDGGKVHGDTGNPVQFTYADKLYSSYLINFSQTSKNNAGRAEVRIGAGATAGSGAYLVAADKSVNNAIYPALAYNGSTVTSSTVGTGTLALNQTYLIIARFTNAGNSLGVNTNATWTAVNTNVVTVSSNSGIAVGQLVRGTGIANNTTVTAISGTSVTLSNQTTAASPTNTTLNFTNNFNSTASWANGTSVITVASVDGVVPGQLLLGNGIAANTFVSAVDYSTGQITLSTPVSSGGTVQRLFFVRTGRSSLFALTLPQYESFISSSGGMGLESYLDNPAVTVGTAANQISVRFNGTDVNAGTFAFRHGNAINLIAEGTTLIESNVDVGAQKFKLDEIRYGYTLWSVTEPAPYRVGPPDRVIDDFSDELNFNFYEDSGSGWKSGWYEVAETPLPGGAFGYQTNGNLPDFSLGKRLRVVSRDDSGADQGIRRRVDPAFVDMSKPYTIDFDYRLDALGDSFTSFSDRIQIGADGDADAPASTASSLALPHLGSGPAKLTWLIGAVGAADRGVPSRKWYFFNNTGASMDISGAPNEFIGANMVDTGILVVAGITYSFHIEVDPVKRQYTAKIVDRDNDVTFIYPNPAIPAQTPMKFRNPNAATSATSLLFSGIKNTADSRSFSIDNIVMKPGITTTDPYPAWADAAGFPTGATTADKSRGTDFDKDGQPNFVEFALDGNPTTGKFNNKVVSAVSTIDNVKYYTLTLPVLTGRTFSGSGPVLSTASDDITYAVEGSYDLINFNAPVVRLPSPLSANMPILTTTPGWEYQSFRLSAPMSAQPKGFLRVKINNTAAP